MINLNVGGQIFTTTIYSLHKAQYFNHLIKNKQELNNIFIDRDPKSFYWLLNYLRGYNVCLTSGPLSEKDNLLQLLDDAKFFGVKPLEVIISEHLDPNPSYEDLISAEQAYIKEYSNMYATCDEVVQPKEYCSLEKIERKIKSDMSDTSDRTDRIELDRPAKIDIGLQIKCREAAIKEWKMQRYMQSSKKMILTSCMILEYMFPQSTFTANLGSTVSKKLNDNTELRNELQDAVTYYLEKRANKPFSPIIKLCLSLLLAVFFQGINQPKPHEKAKPLQTIKEILTNYP